MPRDHLTSSESEAYLERRLSGMPLLAASDHLAECEACRAALRQLLGTRSASFRHAMDDSVSYEDLANWVDDKLDPLARREVAGKILQSAPARRELADLLQFRERMRGEPSIDFSADPSSRGKVVTLARWALPLAAVVLLSLSARWWFVQSGSTISSRELQALTPELQASILKTLRNGKIDIPPAVRELRGQNETLAGAESPNSFKVSHPLATVVRETAPHFQWESFPDATDYQINIVDATSGELIFKNRIAGAVTNWNASKALEPGKTYSWEIEALQGDALLAKTPSPPQPEARFRILSESESADLQRIERSSASPLVVGLAQVRFGLLDEATDNLEKFARQNPNSKIALQLLEQLRRERLR